VRASDGLAAPVPKNKTIDELSAQELYLLS
jgi:hypothetical protein